MAYSSNITTIPQLICQFKIDHKSLVTALKMYVVLEGLWARIELKVMIVLMEIAKISYVNFYSDI